MITLGLLHIKGTFTSSAYLFLTIKGMAKSYWIQFIIASAKMGLALEFLLQLLSRLSALRACFLFISYLEMSGCA